MPNKTLLQTVHNFFEKPSTPLAKFVHFVIVLLIIASVAIFAVEQFYPQILAQYKGLFTVGNRFILAVFTVEYILRFVSAPNRKRFFVKPFNLVDFIAVFPNYIELILPFFIDTTALRGLRLVRLLRFARIFRVFRLVRYGKMIRKIFSYNETILQVITPVLVLTVVTKGIIWILEYYGFWFENSGLGELFAIIGFALGIILSQKIAAAYDKFVQVEEMTVQLYGTLSSLKLILNKVKPKLGTKICYEWGNTFIKLLEDPKANNYKINEVNKELYDAIYQVESVPAELAVLHGDIVRDSAFVLGKKVRLTPKPYDTLLNRATILYILLVAIFIPGGTGMISVLIATYILYGMYNLTQDFDSIIEGEYNLININISEFKQLVRDFKKEL